ncbi:hypothetical protein H6P81_020076 [Aristolochia fimbriata]|uniref:Uncharacterized protein n=1 Tax=Aristolochia fimbriata TaxID=158543 RepID=A0AAV7DUM9_ARIFI|nr:hypothetical protein H6P81_020076 [Aristolochia fimbriata]
MEEEKAAAYYDELTRKGEGAAKFKQGLGFSSSRSSDANPPKSSTSSSFLAGFVQASKPATESDIISETRVKSVREKLNSKSHSSTSNSSRYADRSSRSHHGDYDSRRRRESRDREGEHRSEFYDRGMRERRRRRSRSRSRSSSPRSRRSGKRDKSGQIDYSRLIEGYDNMSAAERVKAKMKLQLSETASKDEMKNSGWERFEFDKEAPLDDEEIEVAEDDADVVKSMEQGYRFSAVEAKQEAESEAAHDRAMFGRPTVSSGGREKEFAVEGTTANDANSSVNLLSDKVLSMQQGSWRDRARKEIETQLLCQFSFEGHGTARNKKFVGESRCLNRIKSSWKSALLPMH